MSYQLTLEPLGATIEVEDGQTLLDAALRQGIYIPHACGHGLCGTCKVQVTDGEVDHGAANPFALMEMERDDGMTLACCATLQSDATIEADIEDEPDAQVIPVRDFSGNFAGHKAYLCGPPPMIEACIGTLMQGRLFERDIYTEKFLSAADAQKTRSPLFRSI